MPDYVLITGSNRGLGLEFCRSFLNRGRVVIAACRNPDKAGALMDLKAIYPDHLIPEYLDISSEDSIHEFFSRIKNRSIQFDLVISNAGVSDNESFGEWTRGAFYHNLDVNTVGPALLGQGIAEWMKEGSKLIQISSGMGSIALNINETAPLDAYAVSKAALNMVTRRLANHLSLQGITVVSIDPGWIRTDMGGEEAPLSPKDAIEKISTIIDRITFEDSGSFLDNNGEVVPW